MGCLYHMEASGYNNIVKFGFQVHRASEYNIPKFFIVKFKHFICLSWGALFGATN